MNKKLNLLLISFLASIGVFVYLSYHHYMVKLGLGGASLCQISEAINCDVAALSRYAEVFSIPIAVLGLSYSIIMFGIFLFARLSWFDESSGYKTIVKGITGVSALISIVLLIISVVQLKAYCPLCIVAYVLSFIIMTLTWSLYSDSKINFSELSHEKGVLGTLLAVPVLAWFISGSIRDNYGLDQLEKIVPEKIRLWQQASIVNFDASLGLSKGSSDPQAPVIVEFADFKCPHCKSAAGTLKNFLAGNKNAKLIFKPYPLDGICNPHIPSKGDGSRCELAGWALCGEKLFNKGWDIHYWIFDHQEDLIHSTNLSSYLTDMSSQLSINAEQLKACATSAETYEAIKKMTDEGETAKISGTPSVFVNGKKLEHGQFIEVLRSAIDTIK
jgi:protein-disulfide isomerase/uncharacterized membrane protein